MVFMDLDPPIFLGFLGGSVFFFDFTAARFSFLLSVPSIAMAAVYETRKLLEAGNAVDWTPILIGVLVSAVSAYLCIHYFLKLLDRIGMLPFVIYRLLLGVFLLAMFW